VVIGVVTKPAGGVVGGVVTGGVAGGVVGHVLGISASTDERISSGRASNSSGVGQVGSWTIPVRSSGGVVVGVVGGVVGGVAGGVIIGVVCGDMGMTRSSFIIVQVLSWFSTKGLAQSPSKVVE
jgi:hypothetical protein